MCPPALLALYPIAAYIIVASATCQALAPALSHISSRARAPGVCPDGDFPDFFRSSARGEIL